MNAKNMFFDNLIVDFFYEVKPYLSYEFDNNLNSVIYLLKAHL